MRKSGSERDLYEIEIKPLYLSQTSVRCRSVLSRLPRKCAGVARSAQRMARAVRVCFTHIAQRGAFRRDLLGLLSDMLERVSDPGTGSLKLLLRSITHH